MKNQSYDYGLFDYLQLSAWYVMLGIYVHLWGWIFGLIAYGISINLIALLLKKTMNLEMMSGGDEIFFQDDHRNCLNIVAFQKYEKFNADEVARQMVTRACIFPRLKSKITKFLGKYFFEPMTDKEMIDSIVKTCPVVTGVHNEEQLAEFMAKEQSTRLPLDYLQWRVFLIPDYTETESLFVYKVHHSLADGIANILMFVQLTDEPKMEDYPNILVRFSWLKDLIIKAIMPFLVIKLGLGLLIRRPERNGFKTDEMAKKLSALKNVQHIPDISTELIKKRAKQYCTPEHHITFNDVLMTALSKTLHDYLREVAKDEKTKFIGLNCPFSLRRPPAYLNDFEFNNDFAFVLVDLRLVDNIKDGIKQINQDMNKLKKSVDPIGLSYLIKVLMQFPEFIRAFLLEDFSDKFSLGFSNVPGPKNQFITAGKKAQSLGFITPTAKTTTGSFSIISHADVVKMTITMDKSVMESMKPLADYLMKNLDEVLGGPEWRNYQKERGVRR